LLKEVPEEEQEIFKEWTLAQANDDLRGYSPAFLALGTMILWVAWLFFNGGSTLMLQFPR
jgi:ammonia channel protein AmtB